MAGCRHRPCSTRCTPTFGSSNSRCKWAGRQRAARPTPLLICDDGATRWTRPSRNDTFLTRRFATISHATRTRRLTMLRFIVYRSLYALLLLFVASVVIFYGLRVAPGEVTDVLTNAVNRIYMVDNLNEKLGLDKPLPAQYFIFMGNLLRGDPGLSLITGEPINETLREAGVYTLKLATVAALFTYATAIPLGVLAAWKRNSAFDYGVNFLAVLGMAIPNFLLAIWLIQE